VRTYQTVRRAVTVDVSEELLRCDFCGKHAPFEATHTVKMGDIHTFRADTTGWSQWQAGGRDNDVCPTCTALVDTAVGKGTK
jgi:hypothetical protein